MMLAGGVLQETDGGTPGGAGEVPEKGTFETASSIEDENARMEGELPDIGGPGAAEGLKYEPNPKHPPAGSVAAGERTVTPEPMNPQESLDISVPFSSNSPSGVAVDPKSGEFIVFEPSAPGRYHGYAVTWDQLSQQQKNALIRTGQVNVKGKIVR